MRSRSKKPFIVIILMAAMMLLCFVFLSRFNGSSDEQAVPIMPDSIGVGTWVTEPDKVDKSDKESPENISFSLNDTGQVSGKFGKYDFEGSWQQIGKYGIRLVNKDREVAYEGTIDTENEYEGSPTMELKSVHAADSMTWTLVKKSKE